MRSRLGVALFLVMTVALASAPSQSAIPPKAGAACSKQGITKSHAGKKYTCNKRGGKLVWSKGIGVVKAQPKPSQSTISDPKLIPTPSTSSPTSVSPVPTATPTPVALTPLQKMYMDFYGRYLSADKSISPSFNFVRCPNVDRTMAEKTESAYIDSYAFWASVYRATAKVNWLLMSEKDWDCWYETTGKFEGPKPISREWKTWDKDTGLMGHCRVGTNVFCGYGTGVRDGGFFAQYNMIGSNYKIAPTAMTVHHETVHIYQTQLIADHYQTSKTSTLACWFIEGQANLFGVPIAFQGNPSEHRSFEIQRLLRVYPGGDKYTPAEWLKVLNDLKSKNEFCFNNELGYSLGWFALEWTYLNYSIAEMHDFLLSIVKGSTWQEAIQRTMKMDEQAYLSKIAQYLSDEL